MDKVVCTKTSISVSNVNIILLYYTLLKHYDNLPATRTYIHIFQLSVDIISYCSLEV